MCHVIRTLSEPQLNKDASYVAGRVRVADVSVSSAIKQVQRKLEQLYYQHFNYMEA